MVEVPPKSIKLQEYTCVYALFFCETTHVRYPFNFLSIYYPFGAGIIFLILAHLYIKCE